MTVLFFKAAEREDSSPNVGDKITFASDLHTDKGPSSGRVTEAKVTVDGLYLRIKHSDEERLFSWEDIKPGAKKTGHGWLIKARPTDAQAEAGNYKMKRRNFRGLSISVENPAGSVREGADRGGKKWRTKMAFDYGYIRLTKGVDGDHVDCYVGPDEDAPNVYVVTQMAVPDFKKVDEQKAMLGFKTKQDAVRAYLAHYDDKRFLGEVTVMPFGKFKDKVLATNDRPGMVKSAPLVVFFKSYVRAYRRRGKDGKVISVGSYHNSVVPEPAPLRGRGKDTLTGDLFGAQPPKAVEGKKPTVTAPTAELIDEHRRLVQVLESPSHADDKAEAARQREELRGYEGRAGNVRPSYEDVFDLISQYAPKVQPLFADGWQRFPAGNYARQVKEELIRQADYQKERRPHVASALVRAAAEITRREGEESKPTISPSPGAAAGGGFGQPLSMLRDGMDGVDLGAIGEAQYALGADGEVYRRRGDEAGTYGGWRWQFKASHAAQYRKDPLLGAIAERVADLVGSSPMVDGAAASPSAEEPKFIGDADAGQTINGGKVKVIGNFKTKAAAEAAASKSDTYRVTGYEGGKFPRGWVVEEATSGARPVFQGWKRENSKTRSISTRSGRFVAYVAKDGYIILTDRRTSRTWKGEAADKKNPLATVSEVAAAMEFIA